MGFKKRVKSLFKRGPKSRNPEDSMYKELLVIWPNGTWNRGDHAGSSSAEMDLVIRGEILDWWANECYLDLKARFGPINPGMLGSGIDAIPAGWVPSEKCMKEYASKNRYDPNITHYLIGRLEHLGHLRP